MKRWVTMPVFRTASLLTSALLVSVALPAGTPAGPQLLKDGLELFQPREDVAATDLDLVEAYEEAKRLEAEIVEMYREMRAADLSMVQRQTLAASLEATLVPLSDRSDIDIDLLRKKVEDAEDIQAYQEELAIVMRETDAIVANCRELLGVYLDEMAAAEAAEEASRREEESAAEEQEAREASETREEREAREASETKEQREAREAREAAEREAREKLAREAAEELKEAELDLENALKEVQAAKKLSEEEVARLEKEQSEAKEAEESKEAGEAEESKEAREKREEREKKRTEWKELKEKVEKAEEAVKEALEETKKVGEASEEKLAKAEKALEKMQQALASAQAADSAASELAESSETEKPESASETSSDKDASETASESSAEKTKGHTQKAVNSIKSASDSMKSASSALRALKEKSGGGGGNSSGENALAMRQSLGKLARARSGKWKDITDQMRGRNLDREPGEVNPSNRPSLWKSVEELSTVPSIRKVMADSRPGEGWYFVGDWYVLSRYDNQGRENLQKVYPPESILDLNAHYLSEDGKPMKWEYESFMPPQVVPYGWEPWKIYYFYTELYFEEETEVWLAIGSDDRSDLWINDLPVWHSANKHKGWTPGEGFRKVVFQEGHNKVLLRLENGHQGLGFSVYLNFSGN